MSDIFRVGAYLDMGSLTHGNWNRWVLFIFYGSDRLEISYCPTDCLELEARLVIFLESICFSSPYLFVFTKRLWRFNLYVVLLNMTSLHLELQSLELTCMVMVVLYGQWVLVRKKYGRVPTICVQNFTKRDVIYNFTANTMPLDMSRDHFSVLLSKNLIFNDAVA